MKTEFLKELGLEQEVIDKIMAENGKDINAEKEKTTAAIAEKDKFKEQLETATSELEKFKDVKPEELQATIDQLKADLQAKDDEYAAKEADRLFNDSVKDAIRTAGGRNEKAIMALLNLDELKESKNQEADIKAAIEQAKTDNDYMFGSKEPIKNPTGGTGGNDGGSSSMLNAMRAAAGLPPKED